MGHTVAQTARDEGAVALAEQPTEQVTEVQATGNGSDLLEVREMAQRVLRDDLDPTDANTAYKLAEAVIKATDRLVVTAGQTTAKAHGDVLGI